MMVVGRLVMGRAAALAAGTAIAPSTSAPTAAAVRLRPRQDDLENTVMAY